MTPFREDAAVLFDAAEQTYVAVGSKHEELSLRGQAPNGSAVRDDSLFKTYCMTRPLLAVVALAVLGRDALDVPIAQLSDSRVLINRRERLRDVLEHRVRVSQLSVGDVLLSEPARTRSMTVSALSEPSIRLSVPEYSDLVPWEILNELIVARTGTGLLEQIRTRVVEPLALDRHLCFQVDEDLAEEVVDRFVPLLVKTRTSRWLPLVSDATPYFLHHTIGPTISALNSAFGMGRIFRELFIDRCRNLDSEIAAVIEEVLTDSCRAPGPRWIAGFARGTCIGSECPDDVLGHVGAFGGAFVFVDPQRDLVCAGTRGAVDLTDEWPVRRWHRRCIEAATAIAVDHA